MEQRKTFWFWPENEWLSYQLMRILAMIPHGGADVGEALWAASRIDPGNPESWHKAWAGMAAEVEAIARGAPSARTGRDAFLRACTYWRAAAFLIPYSDSRKLYFHNKHRDCFIAAMPTMDSAVRIAEIPFRDSFIDGYLVLPVQRAARPAPVVILGASQDTTAEEHYFAAGRYLAERGFAVILWDGPGQGSTLLRRGIPMDEEAEHSFSATFDWIETQPELDAARIGTIDWGAAGYYSFRAAANDPRLRAVVCWQIQYDRSAEKPFIDSLSSLEDWKSKAESGQLGDPLYFRFGYELDVARHLTLERYRNGYANQTLRGLISRVRCPTLLIASKSDMEDDVGGLPGPNRVLQELGSEDKALVAFADEGPGQWWVQADGMERVRAVMGDWLALKLLADGR